MFENPSFDLWSMVFTVVGAVVLWGKLGRSKRKAYVLSDVLEKMGLKEPWLITAELVIFLSLGCLVSGGIVQPTTPAQALTAGMGWTGMLTGERNERQT